MALYIKSKKRININIFKDMLYWPWIKQNNKFVSNEKTKDKVQFFAIPIQFCCDLNIKISQSLYWVSTHLSLQ